MHNELKITDMQTLESNKKTIEESTNPISLASSCLTLSRETLICLPISASVNGSSPSRQNLSFIIFCYLSFN